MNQALVSDVLSWLEEPAGTCDRAQLFKYLNQARERMYLLYSEIALFEITQCFEVQTFCTDCNTCTGAYQGVTLPRDYQNVEAMWWNDLPVELFSSWREWQRGISPYCECGLSKYDMPGLYSSERDILPHHTTPLSVGITNGQDVGKKVMIRGIDEFGNQREETLTLGADRVFTSVGFKGLRQGSGFSKDRTAGPVILAQEDGRVLSIYAPDETMPGYRRIKITGLRNCDRRVNIRGSRKFFPVYQESDVVECDIRTAYEELVRFLRLNAKNSKDANDFEAMKSHMAQAVAALKGDKSREIGRSTRGDVAFRTPSFGPRQLGRGY